MLVVMVGVLGRCLCWGSRCFWHIPVDFLSNLTHKKQSGYPLRQMALAFEP